LGIFPAPNTSPPLPWDKYDGNRVFWTTSIVPMGGHIVIERLQCPGTQQQQVRVVVNERVQSVPGCEGGVDGMCALEEFERVVTGRWTGGGFCEVCAPGNETCVDGISFYE
jgi:acid phosphatase